MIERAQVYLGRLAALGLTGAVAAGFYLLVLAPAAERLALARDGLLAQRHLLGRLAHADNSGKGPARFDAGDIPHDFFLEGESDAVMAASLQAALQSAGDASGWRLTSTRVLAARQEGGLRLIGIEGRLSTSLAGLQGMLLALEAARPVVVVTSMQVTPAASISDPQAQPDTRNDLAVRLEIFGAATAENMDRSHGKR